MQAGTSKRKIQRTNSAPKTPSIKRRNGRKRRQYKNTQETVQTEEPP
jgi:hypothetical protein